MNIEYIIAPIFFFVSIIFSMVGQGGASAYTPILTLFQIDHNSIPLISLACNVVVTSGATYHFAKAGH
ncbi:sulfite exporter TauE/SafE family protein, partial [bacterium]|nr:sulfite exporter TauE/SafE family protein [bacterium]